MNENSKERFEQLGTKIDPAMAEVLNACCDALQTDVYHLLQWFAYTVIRAAHPLHQMTPEIQKLMTLLESDAGWQTAFNLVAPDRKKIAQVVLILEQEGHKGFGAVMIDRPFMGEARMTECTDDILERVCEVTMHGIYRRLRLMGGQLGCNNLSDVLLTMIDAQSIIELEEENRIQMQGEAQFSESGKRIEYGKRTKAKHHRTPDGEAMRQQRIVFTDEDATTTDMPDERPYGEKADEYMKNLEEQAKADEADDMEKEMGFKPFGQEW
jgi:hypothetical protein